MKVRIIESLCQGHGMCHLACPEIFALSDVDGHAIVADGDIPPDLRGVVEKTLESCPEQAIELVRAA